MPDPASDPAPDFGGAFTQRLLEDAGVGSAMRVLDVGCGPGTVTLRVARLVGDAGSVVGVDSNADALTIARTRAAGEGHSNVAFELGDMAALDLPAASFDAITCRRVLMYQRDQVAAVRALVPLLRPGGLLVIQEHDPTLAGGAVDLPLHAQVRRWLWTTVEREGGHLDTGFALHGLLEAAGLAVEDVRAEAVLQTPSFSQTLHGIMRIMASRIVAAGAASEAEMDMDTLDERLARERRDANATCVAELIFGARARRPG